MFIFRADPERFFYKLTVRYRGAAQSIQQLRDGLIDMDHAAEKRTWPSHAQDHNGFRLLYGSDSEQFISLVTKRSVPEEFNLPPLTLPRPEEEDPQVLKVLSDMIQGVVFSTDQEGNLHARRLCKSRAFYLRGDSVVCMDRRQTYTIFSYRTYVDALFRSKIQSKLRPLREVSLYFGARPKDVKSHGLVTVTMEPQIIQPIHAMFDGGEGSLVGSSKSDSIDMLLRETGSASPADSLLRQQQASLKQWKATCVMHLFCAHDVENFVSFFLVRKKFECAVEVADLDKILFTDCRLVWSNMCTGFRSPIFPMGARNNVKKHLRNAALFLVILALERGRLCTFTMCYIQPKFRLHFLDLYQPILSMLTEISREKKTNELECWQL